MLSQSEDIEIGGTNFSSAGQPTIGVNQEDMA